MTDAGEARSAASAAAGGRLVALGRGLLIVVLALGVGYAVYRFIQITVGFLWVQVPSTVFHADAPAYYVLGIPVGAGLLVAASRRWGADGHNPIFGFAREPVRPRAFPATLANILLSLVGGLVLGPEMALVATGSVIGVALAGRSEPAIVRRWAGLGSLAALAALGVEPLRTGHLDLSEGYAFSASDVPLALLAGVITVAVVAAVRLGAFGLIRARMGDRPVSWQLAVGGLVVGGLAFGYHAATGQPLDMVLTSGEQMIKPLVALGSAGLIAVTVIAKSLCYLVTMGSGFRGGPYFPVMFAGAGIGAVVGLLTTGSTEAPGVAGLIAATLFLAKVPWPAGVVVAVVVGMAFGGVAMLPAALVGGVVGQFVPRTWEPTSEKYGQRIPEPVRT